MPTNPVKLAVIGAGLIGQKHLELVHTNPHCELVAVCDAHTSAASTAKKYSAPFYQDVYTLLAEQTLNGAIIATPTNLHTHIGIACAERGVHILVEKPIAGTLVDARKLLETVERCGVEMLVGHHRRHNLLVQQARALVQNGQIGHLVGVSAMFALLKPSDYYNIPWRTQPGGGPILTNLIHDVDNLRFICGEIESVYALTSSKTRGFTIEDTACLTLKFENGALGTVLISDTTPAPWSYELTSGENPVYPQTGQDCYYFCGTRGSFSFPSMTLWNYPASETPGWYAPLEQHPRSRKGGNALHTQLEHFCRVIQGEETPLISGPDGFKTLAVIQAILESAHRNVPVIPSQLE
jgi:predicted dehydrogenase